MAIYYISEKEDRLIEVDGVCKWYRVFCWWPRRSEYSNQRIWLKYAAKCVAWDFCYFLLTEEEYADVNIKRNYYGDETWLLEFSLVQS